MKLTMKLIEISLLSVRFVSNSRYLRIFVLAHIIIKIYVFYYF